MGEKKEQKTVERLPVLWDVQDAGMPPLRMLTIWMDKVLWMQGQVAGMQNLFSSNPKSEETSSVPAQTQQTLFSSWWTW